MVHLAGMVAPLLPGFTSWERGFKLRTLFSVLETRTHEKEVNLMQTSSALNPSDDRWLNDREVSKLTGKSLSSLRNARCRNEGIPYYKDGRRIAYKLADVLDYMEGRRVVLGGDEQ